MKIIYDIIMPFGISFVICIVTSPIIIWLLRRLKVFQVIRKEGVVTHLSKAGTPTMGGIIILFSFICGCLFHSKKSSNVLIIIIMTTGFGIIGFVDDYLKIVRQNTKGLSPLKKLTAQIILIAFFIYYLNLNQYDLGVYDIPFIDSYNLVIPPFAAVLLDFVAFAGTVNGVNFTDGVDGLASSVTLLVAVFFAVTAVWADSDILPVLCAFVGTLSGFLIFNGYPAKVFMGDTGSLILGGFIATIAFLLNMPLYLLIVGIIYLLEVLSVIIQVGYYKLTHGKRFFKMSPIHHHFELCGYSEIQIVIMFSIITTAACIITLYGV